MFALARVFDYSVSNILITLQEVSMLRYAVIFLIVALIAGVLGFGGLAGVATEAAKIVFFVGLVLFVISLFFGRGRKGPPL